MTTPDKKSHWASLANVLGAKVPPEKYSPPAPPAAPVQETTEIAPPPAGAAVPPATAKLVKPKPAAPKGKDNWGSVLGMLGLRAPEVEAVQEPERKVPVAPAPVAERAAPVERPAPAAPQPTRASDWEKPFLAAQPLPKNLWELVGDAAPPPKPQIVEEIHETYVEVGGNDLALGEDDDGGWEAPRPEPTGRVREDDRARRDRSAGDDGARPRRRRRRRRSEPGVEATDAAPARVDAYREQPVYRDEPDYMADEELPAMEVHSEDDEDFVAPRTAAVEGEADAEGRPRRRRRRRGRGRGRAGEREAPPSSAEPVARTPYAEDLDDDEEDEDLAPPRAARPAPASRPTAPPRGAAPPSRSGAGRMRAREAEEVEDEDHDDHEEIDMAEHRGIPTWHEAMAIVVGANMDARAKNPAGARGGRGRGGRGRGGRGR